VFGSINSAVLLEEKATTQFSSVRESPGRPSLFHCKIFDSVVMKAKKSNRVARACYFHSFTSTARAFSSASHRYTQNEAARSESRGMLRNSYSMALACPSQRTFSSLSLSSRLRARPKVSLAFFKSDFRISASCVFCAKSVRSYSTFALRVDSCCSHSRKRTRELSSSLSSFDSSFINGRMCSTTSEYLMTAFTQSAWNNIYV
jgi:hypothetical protein